MTRSIGLAFQGGGAKVISLIAAADAISGLMAKNAIKVETISGTSAGSLAALLPSAKVDFSKVKLAIRNQDDLIKTRFPPLGKTTVYKAAKFVAMGSTVYSASDFNDLIERILTGVGIEINDQIEDVAQIPLSVVVSDIFMGKSISLTTGGLREVLRKSCAIPFIFTSHKSENQGQYADGGIFDNLPTELLVNSLDSSTPVFAIGFKSDRVDTPASAFDYMKSVVGSVVTNNVARSCEHIGKEYICPINTSLKTLDFDKMISVGLNTEYDAIKAATEAYFDRWLNGESSAPVKTVGQRATAKLTEIEQKLLNHVDAAFRAVPGSHEYVKMSVVANSLEQPNLADGIKIEQLLTLPAGYSLHGTIIPLIDGSGSPDSLECIVRSDGPNGEEVGFTQFLIDDEREINGEIIRRNSLAILFSDNIVSQVSRKLYIAKIETRFGFMAPLQEGSDMLALTAAYWPAEMISIQLSVPASYMSMKSDWAPRGSYHKHTELPQRRDAPKMGWCTHAATLRDVSRGGQLKGLFTRARVR